MAAGWRAVGGRLPAPTTVAAMHSHHIALALAEARVADRQRAATSGSMATAPPRRHRPARALLALAATAALAALAPTGALAQPTREVGVTANAHASQRTADVTAAELAGRLAHERTADITAAELAGRLASPTRPRLRSRDARHAALAAQTPQDLRSPDARDAAEGRGMDKTPRIVSVRVPPKPQPAPADGIAWAYAGIGAGSALGLSLIAFGAALFIAHRRRAAHATPPVAGL
jgi:hypothetical protein